MIITLKEYENGGRIDVYDLVDQKASDFDNVVACCEYFAAQGKYVLITPAFIADTIGNSDYEAIYASLRGTPYWGKCPDFWVYSACTVPSTRAEHKDGVWYEHEGYDVNKNLKDSKKRADTFCWMMRRGVKQSDRIIVEDCGFGRRWAKKTIYNRVHREKQNIVEVYIRTDNGLEILYKKEAG